MIQPRPGASMARTALPWIITNVGREKIGVSLPTEDQPSTESGALATSATRYHQKQIYFPAAFCVLSATCVIASHTGHSILPPIMMP